MEKIIELPKICDIRGNLSFIESLNHIPFEIKRAYWIYDVPGGEERGAHAFRTQHEFIVALSGSFDVVLNDGEKTSRYHLNRSYKGIYVPPMTWRCLDNFSTNSLCFVLSSEKFDPSDYIEDFNLFTEELNEKDIISIRSLINTEKDRHIISDISVSPVILNECFRSSSVNDCEEYLLPQIHNIAGNLTALNNNDDIPFSIKRAYYLYDVPAGAERGGHAHKNLYQFVIAAGGSFDVVIDDGENRRTVRLDRPNRALMIVPGIWREVINFSGGAICMVLASEIYIEDDYIREYNDFKKLKDEDHTL